MAELSLWSVPQLQLPNRDLPRCCMKDSTKILILALIGLLLVVFVTTVARAGVRDRVQPCDTNSAVRAIKCLGREPGLRVDVGRALRIANCESGVGRSAPGSYKYQGVFQLLSSEFRTFQHQGPHWVVRWIKERNYTINSSWANVAATFAHVHRVGWGFIGECD